MSKRNSKAQTQTETATPAPETAAMPNQTETAPATKETAVTAKTSKKAPKAPAASIPAHLATAALVTLKLAEIEAVTDEAAIDFDPRTSLPVAEYLVASMRERGFDPAHPVIVWRTAEGKLRRLAGGQRMKAAAAAGLTEVVAVIDPTVTTEKQALLRQIADNGQRQDDGLQTQLLNAKRLEAQGFDAAAIATALGLATASAAASLLKVSRKATPEVVALIEAGLLDQTTALHLSQQPAEVQREAAEEVKKAVEQAEATGETKSGKGREKAATKGAGGKLKASKSLVGGAIQRAKAKREQPQPKPAPVGPRTGKPAADEVAALKLALTGLAVAMSSSKETRHVASAAAAVIAFLDNGTMPSQGFAASYPEVVAAFKAMR